MKVFTNQEGIDRIATVRNESIEDFIKKFSPDHALFKEFFERAFSKALDIKLTENVHTNEELVELFANYVATHAILDCYVNSGCYDLKRYHATCRVMWKRIFRAVDNATKTV